ncbi:MAG: Crp/Fnr family transcriptional regulator [Dysgonamonadaceae bacterium]|jgi:CRP-like cAMP-binding protein|nr:Crp/Fnr family transcriptional regulator [Dysgonamonadaceae bacterium]
MYNLEEQVFDLSSNISEVWRLLREGERDCLREHASIHCFRKGQIIYSVGDEPKDLMCLLSGKVKIYKEGIGGRNQIIRIIKPIQYFAYRAYFANEAYLTAAAAFEASSVCLIPMKIVMELLRNNFKFCQFFICQLSVDLGITEERTVTLTQKHIRGRLAESLIFLIDSYGLEEDNTINIYLSREDLANLSNMTTSNAIRILSTFVSEKIIVLDGRKIKVLDEEKLRKISRLG